MWRLSEKYLVLIVLDYVIVCAESSGVSCSGPATPGELSKVLLGPDAQYYKVDRPSVAAVRKGLIDPPPPYGLPHHAPADEVEVQYQVFAIPVVDQQRQEFTIDAMMRMRWLDPRLAYNDTTRGGCFDACPEIGGEACEIGYIGNPGDVIWIPYLWLPLMTPFGENKEVVLSEAWWIRNDGRVWWTRKIQFVVRCLMDFSLLPYDTQVCKLKLASFRDSDRDVVLKFFDGTVNGSGKGTRLADDLTVDAEWKLEDFVGEIPRKETFGSNLTRSSVDFTFKFKRYSSYYEKHVLQMNFMFSGLTYGSFFVSRANGPDRLALTLLNLLVIAGLVYSTQQTLPKISGDVWLLDLLITTEWFIGIAALEYVVCNFLYRVEWRVDQARESALARGVSLDDLRSEMREQAGRIGRCLMTHHGNMMLQDQHLDIFARYSYPVSYLVILGLYYMKLWSNYEQQGVLVAFIQIALCIYHIVLAVFVKRNIRRTQGLEEHRVKSRDTIAKSRSNSNMSKKSGDSEALKEVATNMTTDSTTDKHTDMAPKNTSI